MKQAYVNYTYKGPENLLYEPSHASEDSAGCDLRYIGDDSITLIPGSLVKLPVGISVEIPVNHEGQLRLRSGFATKNCVTMFPPVGTIDADYRGEISVVVMAMSFTTIVHPGDRIAQLIIAPYVKCDYNLVKDLKTTDRGTGGFGSTGK